MKQIFSLFLFAFATFLFSCSNPKQSTTEISQNVDSIEVNKDSISHPQRVGIQMTKEGGVYTIPCIVNGVKMNFVFDTGASNVCISLTEALFLYKNGYIDDEDIGGKTKSVVADGSITTNTKLTLKTIEIGGIVLRNVDALVSSNIEAPLLLGQSALQKLGKFEIDGDSLFFTGVVEHPQIHQHTQDETSTPIPPLTPKITIWDKIVAFFGNEKKVEDYCIKAWDAYQNDMPELALEYCDKAVACRKRSWKPYAVQGKIILDMMKHKLNKESQASPYFSKAVKLNKYKETFYLNENDSISYKYTLEKHCLCFALWGGIEALKEAQSALAEYPNDASLINTISFYYTQ
ncbi:MAG: retroviral-like aspartic protease family protein, partial [Paludibacteraceae bacterium]|nr:retroviral-like aspartic protease family protein [Paludibacteraceae bacterium]